MVKNFIKIFLLVFVVNIKAVSYEDIWTIHRRCYQNTDQEKKQYKKVKLAFQILSCTQRINQVDLNTKEFIYPNIWQDYNYNFFYGNINYPHYHILNFIARTKTTLGYAALGKRLTEFTNQIEILQSRQANINELAQNNILLKKLTVGLKEFAKIESDFYLMLDENTQEKIIQLVEPYYVSLFSDAINEQINKNKYAVQVINNIDTVQNLMSVKNIAKDLKKKGNKVVNVAKVISKNREIIKDPSKLINIVNDDPVILDLEKQMRNLAQSIKLFNAIYKEVKTNEILATNLTCFDNMDKVFAEPCDDIKEFLELDLSSMLITGKILALFKSALSIRPVLLLLAQAIAEIDMYASLATYLQERKDETNKLSLVEYINNDTAYLTLNNFWPIFMNPNKAIATNISLGSANNKIGYNLVLSGAEQSGKTVFQNSLLLTIILAQTLTIVQAEKMVLKPFDSIKYNQVIAKALINQESLYKLQIRQLTELFNITSNDNTYLSIDVPNLEAMQKEHSVLLLAGLLKLTHISTHLTVLSTNSPLLTLLQSKTNNYYLNAHLNDYKLRYGIAPKNTELNFNTAIEDGFDKKSIKDALTIIDSKL